MAGFVSNISKEQLIQILLSSRAGVQPGQFDPAPRGYPPCSNYRTHSGKVDGKFSCGSLNLTMTQKHLNVLNSKWGQRTDTAPWEWRKNGDQVQDGGHGPGALWRDWSRCA